MIRWGVIRWSYVITRLIVLCLLVCLIWLLLNPGLHFGFIVTIRAMTGARVEIAKLKTQLLTSQIDLQEVQIADPNKSLKNLLEFEQATFNVESQSILNKRLVISEGRISGIEFHSNRNTSGLLEKKIHPETSGPGLTNSVIDVGENWLDSSYEQFRAQIQNDLQSVRLVKELKQRWPDEYDALETNAKEIATRGKTLATRIEDMSKRPLDHLDRIQQTYLDIDRIRDDSKKLHAHLHQLRKQMASDRVAIQRAKQHDEQYVRERLDIENINGSQLSDYLLGPEIQNRIAAVTKWIQWSRRFTGNDNESVAKSAKKRGVTVTFPSMVDSPDFLIKKLTLDGNGTVDGKSFRFEGSVFDVTHQPQRHPQPTSFSIVGEGAIRFHMQARFDRRNEPQDHFEVDIPAVVMPSRQLGQPNNFSVTVSEGEAKIRVVLTVENDDLLGKISFFQKNVNIKPQLSHAKSKKVFLTDLEASFDGIQSLRADLEISGSIQRPEWELRSDLGPQMANVLNQAAQQELAARETQLLNDANRFVDREMGALEAKLLSQHESIFQQLQIGEKELSMIRSNVAAKLGGKDQILNKGKELFDLWKR